MNRTHEPRSPASAPAVLPHATRPTGLRRLDLRLVVGVALLVVGLVMTAVHYRQADQKTAVLVAARPVAPGQILTDADIGVAEVGLSPGVVVLQATDRDVVVGRPAAGPLAQGQLLSAAAVADTLPLADGEVGMSVPVSPSRAVGGALQPGQWVRVVATPESGGSVPVATVVLNQARIVAVSAPDQLRGVEGEGTVTLAVPQEQAPAVAGAAAQGSMDLLLLPGPPTGAEEP